MAGITISLLGCGGDSGTDPLPQLESLPADAVTVQAAVDFVLHSPMIVPSNCSGSPTINCVGGVPGAQIALPVSHTTPTVTELAPGIYTFATDVTLNSNQAVPFTYSGTNCTVTINTSQGTSPTVHVSGTATFLENESTGKTYLSIEPTVTGLEEADVAVGGESLCTLSSGFKGPIIESVLQSIEEKGGQLCGAPGPPLFVDCAATTLTQRSRRGVFLALQDMHRIEL